LRAGGRSAGVPRHGARLRHAALRLRPPDRLLPGDQAQARGRLRRPRTGPLERLLRRLGVSRRRSRAAARRRRRARLRDRGVPSRVEGEHPDAWRRWLHLGFRLPPVLSPFQAPGADLGRGAVLEKPAGGSARNAQRGVGDSTMDFNDTQEEAAFRAEARAFLAANAQPKNRSKPITFRGHIGPEEVKRAKAWQAKKADAGFAGITWPKRFGGRELSPMMQVIYQQEESNYVAPAGVFEIGLGMCIPTLMAYAKPEQLERHVRPALRGEDVWCQLFSEPAGGSDLAALRTRAVKDGDDWVINGQKI